MDIVSYLPRHILLRIMQYACKYNERADYRIVNKHWNKSLLCLRKVLCGDYVYTNPFQKRTDILVIKNNMNSYSRMFICKYLSRNIDPSVCDNYAIKWAARNGYLDVVKYLVELRLIYPDWEPAKRIDPSAGDNYAIQLAARKGYLDVIKYLLRQQQVLSKLSPRDLITIRDFVSEK